MKFSTIGTSWITDVFIESAKAKDMTLVSVHSRSEENGKAFAQKHNARHYFTELSAMLKDESDFVYIASPNSLHYEHILQCIHYKKHVFCEKPIVINEAQWLTVKKQADQVGVFVFEGYRHLFTPNYNMLKQSLSKVGQMRHVFLPFSQYSSRYDALKRGEQPNVFSKEFAGGVLMDLGVYPLSLAIDLFGEPKTIHYVPVLLENGVDGSGTLILNYGDFNATIICSKISCSYAPAEFQGEAGTLTMDHLANTNSLTLFDLSQKKVIDLTKDTAELDMVYQLEAFEQMIKHNELMHYRKWLERSRQIVKWTEKARKSVNITFPDD